MSKLRDLVLRARSVRRFQEEREIPYQTLVSFVDTARLTPSAANRQYLKYRIVRTKSEKEAVFPALLWAAYLKDFDGPREGERPSAYLVLLRDKSIQENLSLDEGIAAESIVLSAAEEGIGACMMMSVNRPLVEKALSIPEGFTISMVIALGYPKETIVLEDLPEGGDIRYYRTADGVHHVPKRTLEEVLLPEGGRA